MKEQKKITIIDIANILNISKSTVSRAFRDSFDINPETKKKILALAKELDYEPDPIAKSLKEKKTKTIGILIPSFTIPFYATAICGIQEVVTKNGYNLLVCQSDESYHKEVDGIKTLVSSKVDGIIMSVSSETTKYDHITKIAEKGIPIVLFNRTTTLQQFSKVKADDYGGAYRMTEYLISKGHKRIVYISGPSNLSLSYQRLSGYKDAMYVHQLAVTPDMIQESTFSMESGREAASRILKQNIKPDAIFCICDNVAFGVIQHLKERKLRIPEDIAVAGYTDEPVASLIDPPLTTVKQPIKKIGSKAAELIFKQLKYTNYKPEIITMPVEVIPRASS